MRTPGHRETAGEVTLFIGEHLSAIAQSTRFAQQHQTMFGHAVGQHVVAVDEPRQPRLHPIEQLTVGKPLPLLGTPRLFLDQSACSLAHLVVEDHFARWWHIDPVDLVGSTLIGDGELVDPFDFVIPQVDTHRVSRGRWIDVDDRTADGKLASCLDLVLAAIPKARQRNDDLVPVDVSAGPKRQHRFGARRSKPLY